MKNYRGERSQAEMARLYGVTQQAWSFWEIGTATPQIQIMKQLEDDIGRPMEEIFADAFFKPKLPLQRHTNDRK